MAQREISTMLQMYCLMPTYLRNQPRSRSVCPDIRFQTPDRSAINQGLRFVCSAWRVDGRALKLIGPRRIA